MHEDAWWSVTAREASKSGDRCIARIDGGSDDDITFALDDIPRLVDPDGPGKAIAKCTSGDKVLVAYKDGGWYPSKVTGNAPPAPNARSSTIATTAREAVEPETGPAARLSH